MSGPKVSRGEKALDKLEQAKLLTPKAKQAIKNVIDPFPDGPIIKAGWPDGPSYPTYTTVYKSEVALQPPSGLSAGQTWDAHLHFRPMLTGASGGLYPATIASTGIIVPGTRNPITPKMFTCLTAPSGLLDASLDPDVGTNYSGTLAFQDGPDLLVGKKKARITACGAEAINTSAELYRGGMGYAYRTPKPYQKVGPVYAPPSGAVAMLGSDFIDNPPLRPANIIQLSNTFSGPCENGTVFVGAPSGQRNDFNQPFPTNLVVSQGLYDASAGTGDIEYGTIPRPLCEWDEGGLFLTGLAQNSSFIIRMYVYIEIAASTDMSESIDQSLAEPGTPYSPVALELLYTLLQDMPSGFDYIENPFGEWLMRGMDMLATIAPAVGTALMPLHPAAAAIGMGVGTAANAIKGIYQSTANKVATIPTRAEASAFQANRAKAQKKAEQKAKKKITKEEQILRKLKNQHAAQRLPPPL